MKDHQRHAPDKRRPRKTQSDQAKDIQTRKQSDALMKEVEETNAHIVNPEERERVIPSKPC
jgi:hypothetical protein